MVIRRIRQHVGTHDWFAAAVDLLIVVVGVFIGIQVTNWNDRRIEHQQAVAYRARLIDELADNVRLFRQEIAYYEQVQRHALAASEEFDRVRNGQALLIDAYQTTQIIVTSPKRFIYDEMLSAGLLDRLGDEEIQALASDYYLQLDAIERTYREIPPYRALMRTLIPHEAQAAIRAKCGDTYVRLKGRIIGWRLPEPCVVELRPSIVTLGTGRLRNDPKVRAELNRYVAWLNERIGSLKDNIGWTERLRARLLQASRQS